MQFDAFDHWVRTLPGVSFDVKWEAHRTFCVGEKMFVIAGDLGQETPCFTFKASEMGFEMLVQSGAAVAAPYLARAKWVRTVASDSLSDEDLRAYVSQAHTLISAKLTRKQRSALGIKA